MPQLDTATFRGQVTWLVIVFGVLYRTRRGDVLPKLSRIVKLRGKKRDRTRRDATQYDGERTQVDSQYSKRLETAARGSHGLLTQTMDTQTNWMNQEVGNRNQSAGMKGAMKTYRSYRMNVKLADVYLSKKLSAVSVSPSLSKSTKAKKTTAKAMKAAKITPVKKTVKTGTSRRMGKSEMTPGKTGRPTDTGKPTNLAKGGKEVKPGKKGKK